MPNSEPTQPGARDPANTQGIRGTVTRVEGDFMPPLPENYQGTVSPLQTRVFVFRGKLKAFVPVDDKHPSLVTIVKTDAAGKYSVALRPATYTLLAEVDGRLYLNSYDGDGFYTTVTVNPHAFVDFPIADDSRTTH